MRCSTLVLITLYLVGGLSSCGKKDASASVPAVTKVRVYYKLSSDRKVLTWGYVCPPDTKIRIMSGGTKIYVDEWKEGKDSMVANASDIRIPKHPNGNILDEKLSGTIQCSPEWDRIVIDLTLTDHTKKKAPYDRNGTYELEYRGP